MMDSDYSMCVPPPSPTFPFGLRLLHVQPPQASDAAGGVLGSTSGRERLRPLRQLAHAHHQQQDQPGDATVLHHRIPLLKTWRPTSAVSVPLIIHQPRGSEVLLYPTRTAALRLPVQTCCSDCSSVFIVPDKCSCFYLLSFFDVHPSVPPSLPPCQ